MRHLGWVFSLLMVLAPSLSAFSGSFLRLQLGAIPEVRLDAPVEGQAVQGSLVIRGNTSVPGFVSYEVDFGYTADTSQTWFLIQESSMPVQDGILAVWDTSTITDGEYSVRLLVSLSTSQPIQLLAGHLRVRNYTPIETSTPSPFTVQTNQVSITASAASALASPIPGGTAQPTAPTALPTNPAIISDQLASRTIGTGVAVSLGTFALLGLYLGAQGWITHNRRK